MDMHNLLKMRDNPPLLDDALDLAQARTEGVDSTLLNVENCMVKICCMRQRQSFSYRTN